MFYCSFSVLPGESISISGLNFKISGLIFSGCCHPCLWIIEPNVGILEIRMRVIDDSLLPKLASLAQKSRDELFSVFECVHCSQGSDQGLAPLFEKSSAILL